MTASATAERFESEKGYRVDVPDGWRVATNDKPDAITQGIRSSPGFPAIALEDIDACLVNPEPDGCFETLTIASSFEKINTNSTPIEGERERVAQELRSQGFEIEKVEGYRQSTGHGDRLFITATYTAGGERLMQRHVIAPSIHRMFVFVGTCRREERKANERVFDRVISSLIVSAPPPGSAGDTDQTGPAADTPFALADERFESQTGYSFAPPVGWETMSYDDQFGETKGLRNYIQDLQFGVGKFDAVTFTARNVRPRRSLLFETDDEVYRVSQESLDATVDLLREAMKRPDIDYDDLESRIETIAERQAFVITFSFQKKNREAWPDGTKRFTKIYAIPIDGKTLLITGECEFADRASVEPEFDAIMASFTADHPTWWQLNGGWAWKVIVGLAVGGLIQYLWILRQRVKREKAARKERRHALRRANATDGT